MGRIKISSLLGKSFKNSTKNLFGHGNGEICGFAFTSAPLSDRANAPKTYLSNDKK